MFCFSWICSFVFSLVIVNNAYGNNVSTPKISSSTRDSEQNISNSKRSYNTNSNNANDNNTHTINNNTPTINNDKPQKLITLKTTKQKDTVEPSSTANLNQNKDESVNNTTQEIPTSEKDSPLELKKKYKQWEKAIENPYDSRIAFDFFYNNPHWPLFRETIIKTERHLQDIDSNLITKWFENYPPMTKEGIEAYVDHLKEKEKMKYIKQTWIFQNLNASYLREFRKKYSKYIDDTDDARKVKRAAAENNQEQLLKLKEIITNKSILKYINSIFRNDSKLNNEIINNPSKRYTYIQNSVNKGDYYEASRLLVLTNEGEDSILLANKYYEIRRKVAYFMLKKGEPRIAYVIAKKCQAKGEKRARLEWLQGFITYRFTNQISLSKKHFKNGYDFSKKIIRLSKNAFWLAEVYLSQKDVVAANEWYQKAAQHFSTFYGFLANQRLENISQTYKTSFSTSQIVTNKFNNRELVQILKNVNVKRKYRKYFYLSLIEEIDDPYEEMLLINLAQDNNELDLISANLNKKQHYTDRSYKILHDNIDSIKNINSNNCFVSTTHSVIKKESSFNTKAKSPSGAIGLMQLMPSTAKDAAKDLDLKISNKDLYNKEINLTLGSALLNNLIKKYSNNLVYALYAYNAGSGSLNKYINSIKNLKHLNMLETIELIPIKETRVYVKTVLVNKFHYDQTFNCQDKNKVIERILANNT